MMRDMRRGEGVGVRVRVRVQRVQADEHGEAKVGVGGMQDASLGAWECRLGGHLNDGNQQARGTLACLRERDCKVASEASIAIH